MSQQARSVRISLCFMITLSLTLAFAAFTPLVGQEKKPAKDLKYMEVDVGGGVKMKLVYIEPGKFMMGSPKEEKGRRDNELQHEVEITKGFWMGVYEVTQEEYAKVVGKHPSKFKGARLPVDTVSWNEAMEFCKRLSKKEGKTVDLPTEAEWEYACRAGSKGPYPSGDSLSSKQANIPGNPGKNEPYLGKTARVGSYDPNAFGLHDMEGNVWEWCKDWFKADYYKDSPLRDPQGPAKEPPAVSAEWGRVIRGGCFNVSATGCRCASRSGYNPAGRDVNGAGGFRVVVRVP